MQPYLLRTCSSLYTRRGSEWRRDSLCPHGNEGLGGIAYVKGDEYSPRRSMGLSGRETEANDS